MVINPRIYVFTENYKLNEDHIIKKLKIGILIFLTIYLPTNKIKYNYYLYHKRYLNIH
jgi:hypothetical protein